MDLSPFLQQVETLTKESSLLSAELFRAKSLPTADQVQEQILKRKRFRTSLKAVDARLAEQLAALRKLVSDVQALRKTLEISDDSQRDDIDELDGLKWELIHGEKEARTEASRQVQTLRIQPSPKPE